MVRVIVITLVIPHITIIEYESDSHLDPLFEISNDWLWMRRRLPFQNFRQGTLQIENTNMYYKLWGDLIEHLWAMKTSNFYWNKKFEFCFNKTHVIYYIL
jgi:hypothetical protein